MALGDAVRTMGAVPALAHLGPEALRLIAFSGETRILRAGDVLFRIGDTSDCGYVVLSGTIALDPGKGSPALVKAPALIGESALITQTIRSATALARAPSSVLKISRSLFHRVLSEDPDGALRLRRDLTARLNALQDDLDSLRIARIAD